MGLRILLLLMVSLAGPGWGNEKAYRVVELLSASSPTDSRSKEWKPGKGIPMEVSGMEWIGETLAVAIRKGEVWLVENALSEEVDQIRYRLFASGLHEPLGLTRDGKDLLVSQRSEITRLQDRDGDGKADAYLTECDGWNVSGNYHAYAYGPERDRNGDLWVTLNLGMGPLANNATGWRGWGGVIGREGRFQPRSFGMRSPCGLGTNLAGDVFFSDQQGTWIPATPIYHLRSGVFYGNQESLGTLKAEGAPFQLSAIPKPNQPYPDALKSCAEFVPPAVWLPYNKMGRSATDIQVIDQGGKFGPFDGQLLVGEFTNSEVNRVFLEKVEGQYQGACFPFLKGFPAAVVRLSFAPDGSLFVGMTNRGWSSLGNRSYGLQRVIATEIAPFSIQEMRAQKDGFVLRFTLPVDPDSFKAPGALQMASYTYEYSPRYGGEEINTRSHDIEGVEISNDRHEVRIRVKDLRPLHVHELRTKGIRSKEGRSLDFSDAYYTLNRVPR